MAKKLLPFLRQALNAWLPPTLWALFIFTLSAQGVLPTFTEVLSDFIFKKMAHITVYAVLYYLLFRGVRITLPSVSDGHHWKVALLLCFVYAASDELHQMFVPGRYGTVRDIGYDMIGAGIVLLRQYQYI